MVFHYSIILNKSIMFFLIYMLSLNIHTIIITFCFTDLSGLICKGSSSYSLCLIGAFNYSSYSTNSSYVSG